MKTAASKNSPRGFTLIEIMVVVAIMGLIMAMGVPSILAAVKKDGMRKAINDLQEVFAQARAQAIMQDRVVSVTFHPGENTFSTDSGAGAVPGKVTASALPDGVRFAMLDINRMDFGGSDVCWVHFNPDGTSDEMTIVLGGKEKWRKITLEFSTGIPMLSDVDK